MFFHGENLKVISPSLAEKILINSQICRDLLLLIENTFDRKRIYNNPSSYPNPNSNFNPNTNPNSNSNPKAHLRHFLI